MKKTETFKHFLRTNLLLSNTKLGERGVTSKYNVWYTVKVPLELHIPSRAESKMPLYTF